jgi:pimeloyl-ACP methyl ester carboxylesterase
VTVHVTPDGTSWTVRSRSLGEHGDARWLVSDQAATARRVPTILFLHGAGHEEDHFEQATLWAPLRHRLMDEGWAVIEGRGGRDDGARANWGRPAAQRAYSAYLAHVAGVLDVGPLVVIGRSMGGIGASNLYLNDPLVSSMARGLMLHQAVCNLGALSDVPAGGVRGSGTGQFWPALWRAWGTTDRDSFRQKSAAYDPMLWDPEVWKGKAVWVGVATGDTTVPAADHGLALRRRWAGQPRIDRVSTRLGGNHTYEGLFGAVDPTMAFLYAATRTVPPAANRYRVVSRSRWSEEGKLQLVVDRTQWVGRS